MGPFVTVARMAWADVLDAHVPRQDHLQPLGDALLEAGAVEGDHLVVLRLPEGTPAEVVQRLAAWVLAMGTPPSQLWPLPQAVDAAPAPLPVQVGLDRQCPIPGCVHCGAD